MARNCAVIVWEVEIVASVSYTHLDVYKRQAYISKETLTGSPSLPQATFVEFNLHPWNLTRFMFPKKSLYPTSSAKAGRVFVAVAVYGPAPVKDPRTNCQGVCKLVNNASIVIVDSNRPFTTD